MHEHLDAVTLMRDDRPAMARHAVSHDGRRTPIGVVSIRRTVVAAIAATILTVFTASVDNAQAWRLTIDIYGSGTVEETQNPDNIRQRCGSGQATTGEQSLQQHCVSADIYCGLCNYTILATPAPGFTFSHYQWIRPIDISWSGNTSSWTWAAFNAGDYEVRAFFVDNEPPDTAISGGPAEGSFINSRSATFNFSTTQPFGAGTYVCTLNNTPIGCGNPLTLTSLPDGPKILRVQAKDPSTNVDPSAATRSWTVDTTPPVTTLTGGPVAGTRTNNRSAAFTITATETLASLACTLNGAPRACNLGGFSLTDLPDGAYTFTVRATDLAGNQEAVAVTRSWIVDGTPPDTTIVTGPAEGANVTTAEAVFTFGGAGEGGRYDCSVDGAAFTSCSSAAGHRTGPLAVGRHTLHVRALDQAGNVDASPASRAWNVIPVDNDRDGSPRGKDCNDADPSVRPGAVEVPGNGKDDDCKGGDAPLVDSDGDGIYDHVDLCPAIARGAFDADADGCVGPYARMAMTSGGTYTVSRRGVKITEFHVNGAPRRAKVEVLCAGNARKCPYRQTRIATSGTLRLSKLAGKLLKPGQTIVIGVTRAGMIGEHITRTVKRPGEGRAGVRKFARKPFKVIKRCLPAGSLEPAKTCSSTPATGP